MNKKKRMSLGLLVVLLGLAVMPVYAFSAESSSSHALAAGSNVYLPIVLVIDTSPSSPIDPTPVPQSDPFTFVSWADTKSGTAVLASISNQVKRINPAFTIYEGDLEDAGFTATGIAAWKTALNGNSSNGMFDITFPLRGNHDTSNTSAWQAYFDVSGNSTRIGGKNFSVLSRNLTYAFDYKNAIFIGIDIPGDAPIVTSSQIAYLDSTLTAAESRGLTHAFVFFHGPIYPVSNHTTCTTRTCSTAASVANLVKVLNKHSIVSAIFNGHEHIQAYVHIDSSRVPEITHPFEQFITGSAGAAVNSCNKTFRFDYCGEYPGFASITVSGKTFTVKFYQQNNATPVKTYSFNKD